MIGWSPKATATLATTVVACALLVAASVFVAAADGPAIEPELAACRRLAPKYDAEPEVTLWDNTRVDLLTPTEAIEVDWPQKYAEAVGQATWYAIATNRRPAVILLVRDLDREARHIYRATAVCRELDIKLYLEHAEVASGQ